MAITQTLQRAACIGLLTLFSSASHAAESHPKVVATFSIIGDFARQVGGDRIDLTVIVGSDADAHVYEPRPSDVRALAKADIILTNGLGYEGFFTRLIDASESTAKVSVLTDGATVLDDPAGGHYHFVDGKAVFHAAPKDSHAWQSIANAKVYVANIARDFCAVAPQNCAYYQDNAKAYTQKLNALDERIARQLSEIPQEKRHAVVGHNAFRYFGEAYGIMFLSPQGVSTDAEASAADVAGLVKEMRANNVKAVFAENISNNRLIKQIAREAGVEVSGTLYSDALSAENGIAPSYIQMMEHNAALFVKALP